MFSFSHLMLTFCDKTYRAIAVAKCLFFFYIQHHYDLLIKTVIIILMFVNDGKTGCFSITIVPTLKWHQVVQPCALFSRMLPISHGRSGNPRV